MGFTDRQQRERRRQAQKDRERRQARRDAQTLEELLEVIEREYEEEIEDVDGETTTVTRTEKVSPLVQAINEVLGNEPVQRQLVSEPTLDEAREAYSNENPLKLARLAFEVASGVDPAESETDTSDDDEEEDDEEEDDEETE